MSIVLEDEHSDLQHLVMLTIPSMIKLHLHDCRVGGPDQH
jgi:hypothetical protein